MIWLVMILWVLGTLLCLLFLEAALIQRGLNPGKFSTATKWSVAIFWPLLTIWDIILAPDRKWK